ncbi:unnamed protein product [Rotaria sp. Silwood2]|nr:unnamed protein product [Rotaria sp. Silwood2]CAF2731549.1 unnamed protein product [Rotaria sp. Silwood2]CAF3304459.1 unnamed protein product [Rotaria sp. Silwood2]CAF4445878.1 unnamed protein product [Rotaria sp. Silwood2]CAF4483076.1 unnamed protein product [Rotaria sp. Silwood2]
MEETFPYFDTKGMKIERNCAEALNHIFNHNTHHRGQITAAITKHGGYDASSVLDLVAMPKDEYNIINSTFSFFSKNKNKNFYLINRTKLFSIIIC